MNFKTNNLGNLNHFIINKLTRIVNKVIVIVRQFPYNGDTKLYTCTLCNHGYKTRRYNNGKLNNNLLKHFNRKCFPKKKRDHRKCSNGEKRCERVLQELFPGSDVIQGTNKLLTNELGRRFPKADFIVDYSMRVQFKLSPYVAIHNWIKMTHIQYAKDTWGIHDIYERLVDMILKFEDEGIKRLKNYRKSKRDRETKDAKLAFISLVVKRQSDNDYKKSPEYIKITDLNTKKLYLHWNKNEEDNFYYMYGTDMTLFKLTDEIINNMNIVYHIRPIYNTSGDSSYRYTENIFKNNTDVCEMIDRINSSE